MMYGAKKRKAEKSEKNAKKEKQGFGVASSIKSAKKNRNASLLKGPVVAHANGDASRDSANDRHGVPYRERDVRHAHKRGNRTQHAAHSSATPSAAAAAAAAAQRRRGASSAAQRRAILKVKGDENLLEHFRTRLSASTFRLLNEQIYNSTLAFASQLLRDPSNYADYHNGYQKQLSQWPLKPHQVVIDALLGDRRGRFLANKAKSMPGYIPSSWVIADMGCGDAKIAHALQPKGYTVHSFDFTAVNEHVTVANSANVPLDDNSVDICVFSLSLMSTDYIECLYEAFRVLKPRRLLKIVEVRSRIPHPRRFAELIEGIGFKLDYHDTAEDYFVVYDFLKCEGQAKANRQLTYDPNELLVASLYKKR